ncbi:G-protein coupled receptor 98 [Crotalus adamanteus]|uniref:G-protein coupled receptor 98 n=1 Tax=Crotalus adamanteus TaxID=8729 RepID=A0AAW1C252_CROAD
MDEIPELDEFYSVLLSSHGDLPNITIYSVPDEIPEEMEVFIISLFNTTGGASLGNITTATLQITKNDYPIYFADKAVEEGKTNDFLILRQRGYFGNVSLAWQLFGNNSALDPGQEFYEVSGTVWFIEGEKSQPITLHAIPDKIPEFNEFYTLKLVNTSGGIPGGQLSESKLSVTVMIPINDDPYGVFILDPQNQDREVAEDIQSEDDTSCFISFTSNMTYIAKITIMKYLEENIWLHLLIMFNNGTLEFFIDGKSVPGGIKSLKGKAIADGQGIMKVGAGINGGSRYKGLMQDVRFYECKLTKEEISELHTMPARSDLYPISGYLEYRQGERNKSFIVSVKDDKEEEGEELFILKLISVYGGARISQDNATATLRIQKSDNANGLFGFTGACIPEVSNEGSTVSCVVERTRGALDSVFVYYTISQIDSYGVNYTVTDFANSSGIITFLPFQRSEVLNLHVLDDDIPELKEYFQVTLVSAITGDGKTGSTPTSGGSIDPEKETTYITVKASDHPYGLLQFSVAQPPSGTDETILSAMTAPHITIKEEIGQVSLLVVRAQGLLGTIVAQYRTVALTAFSPQDYQGITGTLEFLPGERYKHIFVNITDNSLPELEKAFKVELLNPDGAVSEFFNGGSGSGDGDFYFLPPVHQYAGNLGIASHIIVTIEASDDAHGVFEFSAESLSQSGVEPEDGRGTITFEVIRHHGALSQLSAPAVQVPENYIGPIINVTRTGGIFADVSVKFRAVPITATAGEDYSVASSDVVLLEGETSKAVPIYIINDINPEAEESFLVQLLNQTTGGALLGSLTQAVITVEASDDPFGSFVFQTTNIVVKEPEVNTVLIDLPVIRNAGTLGNVTIEWIATIDRQFAASDLKVFLGNIQFSPGETMKNLTLEILNDDVPEIEEIIRVELTQASNGGETKKPVTLTILDDSDPEDDESIQITLTHTEGGSRILLSSATVTMVILANDNVAGILSFQTSSRSVIAHEGELLQFHVLRTAPGAGNVTVDWEIVGHNLEQNFENISGMLYFLEGALNVTLYVYLLDDQIPEEKEEYHIILHNIKTQGVTSTGSAILDHQGYEAVLTVEASDEPYGILNFASSSRTVLVQEENKTIQLFINREFGSLGVVNVTYTTISEFLGALAKPGVDYIPISGSVLLKEGVTTATINITILEDDIPEMQEYFFINLTSVKLVTYPLTSFPPRLDMDGLTAQIIIDTNDGARGVISWQNTRFDVNEINVNLTLVIFRDRGLYGNVSLFLYAQNLEAYQGLDFNLSARTLCFADGERYKYIEVQIFDDEIPERDERFQLILTNPSLGLELGENTTATITILANDDGHGVLSFNNTSSEPYRRPPQRHSCSLAKRANVLELTFQLKSSKCNPYFFPTFWFSACAVC